MNETRTGAPAAAVMICTISGLCRCTPPTPYADAAPITSEPSSDTFGAFPAPDVPDAATTTTSGADQVGRERRRRRQRGHRRVAARDRHPPRAAQCLPRAGQFGQPVRPGTWPGTGGAAAVEALPGNGIGQAMIGAAVDHHGVRRRAGPRSRATARAAAPGRPRRDRPTPRRSSARGSVRPVVAGAAGAHRADRPRCCGRSPRRSSRPGGRAAGAAPRRPRSRWRRRSPSGPWP